MQISESDIIGAVKVKDGLFIGDEFAAQDLEFIVTNKVTHIINCAGKQIPNHWEPIGVSYLTLNWMETDYQVLFDAKDEVMNEIFKFMDGAQNRAESLLVHSLKGQNRSCCVLAAYFMKRYRWTLYKTLEFLHSRKPNLEIRSNFFSQLMALESKLTKLGFGAKTHNWAEVGDDTKNMESEELLLTNTFLNAKKLPLADYTGVSKENKKNKLEWSDIKASGGELKSKLAIVIGPHTLKKDKTSTSMTSLYSDNGKTFVRSILKGSNKEFLLDGKDDLTPPPMDKMSTPQNPNKSSSFISNSTTPHTKDKPEFRPHTINPSSMMKSASVSVLDRVKDEIKPPGQGNIIHITVNNYITNNNLGNEKGDLSKNPLAAVEKGTPKEKKIGGLSTSSSHKDFTSLLKPKEPVSDKKKGISPPNSFLYNDKFNKNFSATFTNENESNFSKVRINNFTDSNKPNSGFMTKGTALSNPSLKVLGSQSLTSAKPLVFNDRKAIKSLAQQLDSKENIRAPEKPQQQFSSSAGFQKYLVQNPSRAMPIKANVDMNQSIPLKKQDVFDITGYLQKSVNLGNNTELRPSTAPENSQSKKKALQDSPYNSNLLNSNANTRSNKNLAELTTSNQRQGSLQPQKDSSKNMSLSNSKTKLRSQSPGNATTLSYFQESMVSKPKWKY
jgi:protein-tyrosine phosphatase